MGTVPCAVYLTLLGAFGSWGFVMVDWRTFMQGGETFTVALHSDGVEVTVNSLRI